MRARLPYLGLIFLLLIPASGKASAILDFGLAGNGSVSYSGGSNPLLGSSIGIVSVCGLGTPLNDNVCLTITGGDLSFNTGSFFNFDSSDWYFNGGGSISVVGTITSLGISNGTLMSGSWLNANVFAQGDGRGVVGGIYTDGMNSTLTNFFGLPSGGWTGTLNPSIAYVPSAPNQFTASAMGGDVMNVSSVPEPLSLLLVGSGLVGFGAALRRKMFQ